MEVASNKIVIHFSKKNEKKLDVLYTARKLKWAKGAVCQSMIDKCDHGYANIEIKLAIRPTIVASQPMNVKIG